MAMRLSVLFDGDTARLKSSAKQAQSSLNTVKQTAVSVARQVGAAYASYISLSQIVDVTKRYQRLEAQLRTSTGSVTGQAQAMAILSDFAYATGQNLEGLVEGFNKLVNLGLDPSKEALLAYGNVAAGTGKTTMDFIEAVADASVAEFERLKEFGIKAANEGDTSRSALEASQPQSRTTPRKYSDTLSVWAKPSLVTPLQTSLPRWKPL